VEWYGKPLLFKLTKLLPLSKLLTTTVISLRFKCVLLAKSNTLLYIIISEKINEIMNNDDEKTFIVYVDVIQFNLIPYTFIFLNEHNEQ